MFLKPKAALTILILSIVCIAQETSPLLGLGFDSGIAARLNLSSGNWLSVILNVENEDSFLQDMILDSTYFKDAEWSHKYLMEQTDTLNNTLLSIEGKAGRQLVEYKTLFLNGFISARYSTIVNTSIGGKLRNQNNQTKIYRARIGLEPGVQIFDRLTVWSSLGMEFSRTRRSHYYNSVNEESDRNRSYSSSHDSVNDKTALFGTDFNMGVMFWF